MRKDFSWREPAEAYAAVYRRALAARAVPQPSSADGGRARRKRTPPAGKGGRGVNARR
jgi:hypothetical protein